jgi:hypothetical protein
LCCKKIAAETQGGGGIYFSMVMRGRMGYGFQGVYKNHFIGISAEKRGLQNSNAVFNRKFSDAANRPRKEALRACPETNVQGES